MRARVATLVLGLTGCSEVLVEDGATSASASTVGSSSSGTTGIATSSAAATTGTGGAGTGGEGGSGGQLPCGNGSLDPAEECDDGNVVAGDGCAADCLVECEPLDPDAPYEVVWKDPLTFHCYRRVGGNLAGGPLDPCLTTTSYAMVLADCSAWGGDAAALSTLEEFDAVIASPLWGSDEFRELIIGAEDVTGMGDWTWHNGEPWIYAPATPPWVSIEPNGGTFLELYAYGENSGLNADADFSACGFLCERTPAN